MTAVVISDVQPRCPHCGKLLAEEVSRPWTIRCVRCKWTVSAPAPGPDTLYQDT